MIQNNISLLDEFDAIVGDQDQVLYDTILKGHYEEIYTVYEKKLLEFFDKEKYNFDIHEFLFASNRRAVCRNFITNLHDQVCMKLYGVTITGTVFDNMTKNIRTKLINNLYSNNLYINNDEIKDIFFRKINSDKEFNFKGINMSCTIIGNRAWLYSYDTCIAFRSGDKFFIQETFMSPTTCKHLLNLINIALKEGYTVYSAKNLDPGKEGVDRYIHLWEENKYRNEIEKNRCIYFRFDGDIVLFRYYTDMSNIYEYGRKGYNKYMKKNKTNDKIINYV